MFFGHVVGNGMVEDLNPIFLGKNFDTINAGPKQIPTSYVKIAQELGKPISDVLFLSDNVEGEFSTASACAFNG